MTQFTILVILSKKMIYPVDMMLHLDDVHSICTTGRAYLIDEEVLLLEDDLLFYLLLALYRMTNHLRHVVNAGRKQETISNQLYNRTAGCAVAEPVLLDFSDDLVTGVSKPFSTVFHSYQLPPITEYPLNFDLYSVQGQHLTVSVRMRINHLNQKSRLN